MTSSTFPNAYYGASTLTELDSTSAITVLEVAPPNSVTGDREPKRLPLQLHLNNKTTDSTVCIVEISRLVDGSAVFFVIAEVTLSSKQREVLEYSGLVLNPGEKIRVTASLADKVVCMATFLEAMGGSANVRG